MKFLDHLEEWLVTFLMGAATLIIFVAVVHRYMAGIAIPGLQDWLLSISMSWAQELTIIMFVWMCKFGAAYGVRTGIHGDRRPTTDFTWTAKRCRCSKTWRRSTTRS